MPGFDRHPKEAALIGRLLVAFGEIEVSLAVIVGSIGLRNMEQGLRTVYKVRGASSRLEMADALLRPRLAEAGLESEYISNRTAIAHCKTIRNQLAHCIWADDQTGLYFTDLQDASERVDMLSLHWRHLDVPLLTTQLEYFDNTLTGIMYLENRWLAWAKTPSQLVVPTPKALDKPPLHNPPSQHVPLWISADEKRRHLELARESESNGRQPEREPSVLRLTREEWTAKDAKDARLAGESPA